MKSLSRSLLTDALKINHLSLAAQQTDSIILFLNELLLWNKKINLTAHRRPEDLIEKDVIDTLRLNLYRILYIPKLASVVDIGCGGGFAGIILGILNPGAQLGFIESNRKKINFVKEICRKLKLDGEFLNDRVESFPPKWKEKFQIAVSRATWKVAEFIQYAHYYVQNNGILFYMSGKKSKIDRPHGQLIQGLAAGPEFFYKIMPKEYERKVFSFIKNEVFPST
ncbi:MAG: 16S rRNA (guanine(527)-N(7))-methyltransferase RsmG [Deltaproteobacteria bacterium]|nr:16S rRNA (guanine(527)-N(7))-methyltransferase RsmG [Deltaproteobacteria bacterium]